MSSTRKTATATSPTVSGSAPSNSGIPIRSRIEFCHPALFQSERSTITPAATAATQVAFRRSRMPASGSCIHSQAARRITPRA